MKVLIDGEWKNYAVEFGEKMPEDTGGVRLIAPEELEVELWADVNREILELSVELCEEFQLLLARYVYCPIERTEDHMCYHVQLTPEEALAYDKAMSCL